VGAADTDWRDAKRRGGFSIGERSSLDLFHLMFPSFQLQGMRRLTNRQLQAKGKTPKTSGEILKYLGVLWLMTRFEFGERVSLWSTNQEHNYVPPPAFDKTGMSKRRFNYNKLLSLVDFRYEGSCPPFIQRASPEMKASLI
jgi:Transposase IS4